MKSASTTTPYQYILECTREQLGAVVRGKYVARYAKATNIVVIDPVLTKAFPNTEAVNEALRSLLAVATSATWLPSRAKRPAATRVTV